MTDRLQEGVDAMDQWLHVPAPQLLVDVYDPDECQVWRHMAVLFQLLQERADHESISHRAMPTWDEHVAFVTSKPYKAWYLVCDRSYHAGAVFIGHDGTIGVGILSAHRRRGLGRKAVQEVMKMHPGPYKARIAPGNVKSHALFQGLGFQVTHHVYEAK